MVSSFGNRAVYLESILFTPLDNAQFKEFYANGTCCDGDALVLSILTQASAMARLYAGSKILSLIYVNSQQFLCAICLVVRTVDFQSINIGSTPVWRTMPV